MFQDNSLSSALTKNRCFAKGMGHVEPNLHIIRIRKKDESSVYPPCCSKQPKFSCSGSVFSFGSFFHVIATFACPCERKNAVPDQLYRIKLATCLLKQIRPKELCQELWQFSATQFGLTELGLT